MPRYLNRKLTQLRIQKILPYIKNGNVILDLGCGNGELFELVGTSIKRGYGLDIDLKNHRVGNIIYKKYDLEKEDLPFEDNHFDCVTMLAVIEHLNNWQKIVAEARRVLKKDGIFLVTTPTPYAKPVLDVLAGLNLIDPTSIQDHKNYFKPPQLKKEFAKAGFVNIKSNYFQLLFNSLISAQKKG